ncbi:MAG: L-seryl-tRNA(Sec) selenium transferase [Chloroflexota bacterium]|nr:L-seryl-tRNA(Sec) selenium transferase [Chloroflexota bacterium]
MNDLRSLPSVDTLLVTALGESYLNTYGHALTVQAIRETLEEARSAHLEIETKIPDQGELLVDIERKLRSWTSSTLYPVINASGVILHTNLGRAPLSADALQAVQDVGSQYSTLEFDMEKGERGSRLDHAHQTLTRLLDAEAALVVNNNASAVLLMLTALTSGSKVVIARSQLVEIGGGFRIPDVMLQSGAELVEVGTTNRVHLRDYEQAFDAETAAVLRAHRSNFAIVGFTTEPTLKEIAQAAYNQGLYVFDDLGSGALLDTAQYGLKHEPMVQESLADGADLVCFSGDKLLGGPQAGIIVGRADPIERIKHHPLARAVRADKMALSALSATLLHYLKGEAEDKIPVWQMIAAQPEEIRQRAEVWRKALGRGEVIATQSTVGGGSLPGESTPTFALTFSVSHPHKFLAGLRTSSLTVSRSPAVIARIQDERIILDPRTVFPHQEKDLLKTLESVLESH